MVVPADVVGAAQSLVGSRFRLHGRDPATGVDCVGLVGWALAAAGRPATVPQGYALRLRDPWKWREWGERSGLREISGDAEPGDVAVMAVGPGQLHLAIVIGDGTIVHAHAGLGRVVRSPVPEAWRILGHWRHGPQA